MHSTENTAVSGRFTARHMEWVPRRAIRKLKALLDTPGVAPPIQASPEAPFAWATVFLWNDLIVTAANRKDYRNILRNLILLDAQVH